MTKYTKEELLEQYQIWCDRGFEVSEMIRRAESRLEALSADLHEAQQMQRTIAQELEQD